MTTIQALMSIQMIIAWFIFLIRFIGALIGDVVISKFDIFLVYIVFTSMSVLYISSTL